MKMTIFILTTEAAINTTVVCVYLSRPLCSARNSIMYLSLVLFPSFKFKYFPPCSNLQKRWIRCSLLQSKVVSQKNCRIKMCILVFFKQGKRKLKSQFDLFVFNSTFQKISVLQWCLKVHWHLVKPTVRDESQREASSTPSFHFIHTAYTAKQQF